MTLYKLFNVSVEQNSLMFHNLQYLRQKEVTERDPSQAILS